MADKTILLLGGTGTLSTAVLKEALSKGYKATIMNRGSNNKNVPQNVEVVICNFKNRDEFASTFKDKKYDVVVDFLSRTKNDIETSFGVFKNSCTQFIFISSACVYQRPLSNTPITEKTPKPNTLWSYNVEKYECEQKLHEMACEAKAYYSIVRPYITYNAERIPLGLTPTYRNHRTIIERIKAGKPWFVWDDGQTITTVTYTRDFAVGVVGLFLNPKAVNEDFHVTSNFTYTQKELAEKLFQKLNIKANIVHIPSSVIGEKLPEFKGMLEGDRALNAIFDNSKIKDAVPELKFSTSLDEGLDEILDYWNNLSTYSYDYIFEAKIDKLIRSCGVKCGYVQYPHADSNSRFTYFIYSYFPEKIAAKLAKIATKVSKLRS